MPDEFRAPSGTHDVLPPDSARWEELIARFASRARRAGYGLVLTPMFEHLEVFHRVGEASDVVKKEMYEFEDRGGRTLALRPESTASVVRAFVQHRPVVPWKVWYAAPHFRYERPQKGRFRQHHQLGVEVLGTDDPAIDVEVVALAAGFLKDVGLRDVRLLVNSLGDGKCRPGYLTKLTAYLADNESRLCEDSQKRYRENPLRVLDCKSPQCAEVVEKAPELLSSLCDECGAHFEAVQHLLDRLGLQYEVAPRLVRGLDYYTRTAFEFVSGALDAAQSTVCGGGRYDGLAEELGGDPTPGMGFGLGIERLLIACDAEGRFPVGEARVDVFVVDALGGDLGSSHEATVLVEQLREMGVRTDRAFGGRSVKAQWKVADRSGARYGVMIAPEELQRNAVVVRDMQSSEQHEISREEITQWLLGKVQGPSGLQSGKYQP